MEVIEETGEQITERTNKTKEYQKKINVDVVGADDDENLIEKVDEKELEEMGEELATAFKSDWESGEEWRAKRANWLELFMNQVKEKDFPWDNCSNIPVPTVPIAVIQFQARSYEALLPAKNKVKVAKTGFEDSARAERIEKHMNYQIDYQVENFEEGWDVSLFQLPINGSIFRKTYYDPIKKEVCSVYCGADEIVVPYATSPTKAPLRMSHLLYYTENQIRERELAGVFKELEEIRANKNVDEAEKIITEAASTIGEIQTAIRQVSDQADGVAVSSVDDRDGYRPYIEMHCKWDLNGDEVDEPYIVTFDYRSQQVVRIVKRYYTDEKGKMNEIEHFTHYYFLVNPEGYYGLGFGHILEGISEATKAILDQIIDAGTLANMSDKMGFYNTRSGIKAGDLEFEMGKFKGVNLNVDDIRKAIFPMTFSGANTLMYQVLGLLQGYGDRVTTVTETMTGELPSSDTPATAIVNSVEQGMKVFSSIHKRIHRGFKKELRKIQIMNYLYGDNEEYRMILGEAYVGLSDAQGITIAMKIDYAPDVNIHPVSDPNITSRAEKMAIAEQILNKTMANPVTAQNPQAVYEAHKRFYIALGVDEADVDNLYPPPPPPPNLTPEEENAGFIQGKPAMVLEGQDNIHHLTVHRMFMETGFFAELDAFSKDLMAAHEKETLAALYMEGVKNGTGVPSRMANVSADQGGSETVESPQV